MQPNTIVSAFAAMMGAKYLRSKATVVVDENWPTSICSTRPGQLCSMSFAPLAYFSHRREKAALAMVFFVAKTPITLLPDVAIAGLIAGSIAIIGTSTA